MAHTRVHVKLATKVEILDRLATGVPQAQLAREYGLSYGAIYNCTKRAEEIRKRYAENPVGLSVLDKRLIRWIERKQAEGVLLTGDRICRMAMSINWRLGDQRREEFKASNGWLHKFRIRAGLKDPPPSATKTKDPLKAKPVTTTTIHTPVVKTEATTVKTPTALENLESSRELANLIKMKYGKRRGKAKNVEEVDKPRGFERGLVLDQILGAANLGKTPLTLQFLVRWIDCDELDLIPAPEMNEKAPDVVLAYYEGLSSINKKFEMNEKERLVIAQRPAIVSKVEQMMHNESVSNEELFQAVVQEATTDDTTTVQQQEMPQEEIQTPQVQEDTAHHMVQIPQEYNTDMGMMEPVGGVQMGWMTAATGEEHQQMGQN